MNSNHYISLILFLFFQTAWSQNNGIDEFACKKSAELLTTNSDAPLLTLNANEPPDSLVIKRKDNGFCLSIPHGNYSFKLLFNARKSSNNDSTAYCGIRYSTDIMLNSRNMIMYENKIITIDSLKQEIDAYYKSVGAPKTDAPTTIGQVNFTVKWQAGCSKSILEQIFKAICFSYLGAIEYHERIKICNLSSKQIKHYQEQYPLNILLRGNLRGPNMNEIKIIEITE